MLLFLRKVALFCALAGVITAPLHAYLLSHSKYTVQLGDHAVEIITYGDNHSSSQYDDEHYSLLKNNIEQWNTENGKRTLVLLEVHPNHFMRNSFAIPNHILISRITALAYTMIQNNMLRNIVFKECDLRETTFAIEYIHRTLYRELRPDALEITDLILSPNDYALLEHLKNVPLNIPYQIYHNVPLNQITLSAYMQSVDHIISFIKNKSNAYLAHTQPAYHNTGMLLARYHEYMTEAYHYLYNYFRTITSDENIPFKNVIIAMAERSGWLPAHFIDFPFEPEGIFADLIYILIADAGFITNIIDNLHKYDRIVFYGGQAHVIALNHYLSYVLRAQFTHGKGKFSTTKMHERRNSDLVEELFGPFINTARQRIIA